MADYIGQQLGNYRLTQLLGKGGFAEVYLGEHVRLGMKAAVKILHTSLSEDETRAFQQEAQTIATLSHPHIIRVLDFEVQAGIPFLVLDYAPNGTLRHKHPRGTRLAPSLAVDYITQIASALQFAHDRKIIHRDIKPENMLIGSWGDILLSDFGIATIAHSTSSMSAQTLMGTLAYMPPEQIKGKPRIESDQYALAVTIYQWLTGELPFQGSSMEMIAQHLAIPAPPLRNKVSDLPVELEQVILKALAKDPKDRYGQIQEFAYMCEKAIKNVKQLGTQLANQEISNTLPGRAYTSVKSSDPIPPMVSQPLQQTTDYYLNKSKALIEVKQYQEALAMCEQALRFDPSSALLYVNRASALCGLKRYQEALEACDQALQRNSRISLAHYNASEALMQLGRHQQALEACERALQFDPSFPKTYINKSRVLIELGRYQQALDTCNQGLVYDAHNALLHNNAGVALANLGRYQQALEACEQAIRLDPSSGLPYVTKGWALIELGRYQEALVACNQALQHDAQDAWAHNNASVALMKMGRYQEALHACEQALQLNPHNTKAHANKAFILQNLRRY
ncbi:serine/threonine-protein kinase [Ktedonobacter racemifer]|uniref:Serine/threonine protein kinase with TPR repeats n=1 Tax=Ktedonobacter racemifer DSM 44963 TaxID=485913 RepID=D6TT10_KTERA|nr:serine/threonine-protein kinase [Ktedonobacter racemifer]EFH83561.1 serine/threonine protein kinase with TPR repeats [Ktedonobacter racemifer DSM 44963]